MKLLTKILFLLTAAVVLAAPFEGMRRVQAKAEDVKTAGHAHASAAAPHSFVPPGASWEALFNASLR